MQSGAKSCASCSSSCSTDCSFPLYADDRISQVRRELVKLAEQQTDLVDPDDLRDLCSNDRLLSRYMRRKRGCVESSVTFVWDALQWRHRLQVRAMNEADFPKEFYEVGGLYIYRHDREGEQSASRPVRPVRTKPIDETIFHLFPVCNRQRSAARAHSPLPKSTPDQ